MHVNAYLIIPEGAGAILVDAPEGAYESVGKFLRQKNIKLEALLITHNHWDHIWDIKKFKDDGVKIYSATNGADVTHEANRNFSHIFGVEKIDDSVAPDVSLFDGQILEFGDCKIEVRLTPGHSLDSAIFYMASQKQAFVGDLIFMNSIGATHFPGGNFSELEKSIKKKIYTLPDDTKLCPGHGPSTSVGAEKASNLYVR